MNIVYKTFLHTNTVYHKIYTLSIYRKPPALCWWFSDTILYFVPFRAVFPAVMLLLGYQATILSELDRDSEIDCQSACKSTQTGFN